MRYTTTGRHGCTHSHATEAAAERCAASAHREALREWARKGYKGEKPQKPAVVPSS